jgi:hypothetical protein
VAFNIRTHPLEVRGTRSAERLDQARGHLGLRKGAHLGELEPRRLLRWIVILSAIFLHLKKTPITDLTLTTSTYMPKISPYPSQVPDATCLQPARSLT